MSDGGIAPRRFWRRDGRVKVKVCGFTCLDTAYEAAAVGVDALGFHLWSHYDVDARLELFERIVKFLPADVSRWLLTDITDGPIVRRVVEALGIDTLQLQGPVERAPFGSLIQALSSLRSAGRLRVVKSVSAEPGDAVRILDTLECYRGGIDAWLLDSGWKGGTGRPHDWNVSARVAREAGVPLVLAGGLTSDNVEEAITKVRPYGVDVESGVEVIAATVGDKRVRCKSILKITEFVGAVRRSGGATEEGSHGVSTARQLGLVAQPAGPRHDDVG